MRGFLSLQPYCTTKCLSRARRRSHFLLGCTPDFFLLLSPAYRTHHYRYEQEQDEERRDADDEQHGPKCGQIISEHNPCSSEHHQVDQGTAKPKSISVFGAVSLRLSPLETDRAEITEPSEAASGSHAYGLGWCP